MARILDANGRLPPPAWFADINDKGSIPIFGHWFEIVGLVPEVEGKCPSGMMLKYIGPCKKKKEKLCKTQSL